ncbi:MAG: hypothetical protein OHK0023_21660 [Anaerolineae bacterium]
MKPDQVSDLPLNVIEQNPQDLMLAILRGDMPISLTVFAKQVVNLDKLRIDFRIIGESHWITVRRDHDTAKSQIWHELLACVGVDSSMCVYTHQFFDLQTHTYRYLDASLQATGHIWFEKYAPHQLPSLREMQLHVTFPQVHGQMPITSVGWDILNANRLNWWTFHLYPNAYGASGVHSYTELWL